MIVIGRPDRKSTGEKELAAELRTWVAPHAIDGIALLQPRTPVLADVIVVTPHGCVVIEVKGLQDSVGGTINVPYQARWTAQGMPVNLYGCGDEGHRNPTRQAEEYAQGLANALRGNRAAPLPSAWVDPLVVLVQRHRSPSDPVTVDGGIVRYSSPMATATTTLRRFTAGHAPLRRYFHEMADDPRGHEWDIESVETLLDVIGLGGEDRPTRQQLVDEHFRPRAVVGDRSVSTPRPPCPDQPAGDPTVVMPIAGDPASRGVESPAASPAPEVAPDPTPVASPAVPPSGPANPADGAHRTASPVPPSPVAGATSSWAPDPQTTRPVASPRQATTSPQAAPLPRRATLHEADPWAGPAAHGQAWAPARRRAASTARRLWRGFLVVALVFVLATCAAQAWRSVRQAVSKALAPAPVTAVSSPSGNITCRVAGPSVECHIAKVTYSAPPLPKSCRGTATWGHAFALSGSGRARLTCPTRLANPAGTLAQTIPYGQSQRLGFATCTSTTQYLQCVRGGHGIRLSNASYRAW